MWYDRLPARANQAVALDGLRRWCRATGVDTPSIRAFEEHLWTYLTLDQSSFMDWYGREPAALSAALKPDAALPVDIVDVCLRNGIPQTEARQVLRSVAEVTYSGLFGAIDPDPVIDDLVRLGGILAARGAYLPEAHLFLLSGGPTDVGRPGRDLVETCRARSTDWPT